MNLSKKYFVGILALVIFGSVLPFYSAKAVSFSFGSGCIYGDVSLNKTIYTPGEAIIATTTNIMRPCGPSSSWFVEGMNNGAFPAQLISGSSGGSGSYTFYAPMTPSSSYYVKFNVHNGVPTVDGTLNIPYQVLPAPTNVAPTVINPTITNITSTSVTFGANVSSAGYPTPLLERGFCLTQSPPATSNCVAEGGTTTGTFTQNRTGLSPNTLYYYSGYATNSTGRSYTSSVSFTTPATTAITVTVTATPNRVAYGNLSKITWTSTGATECHRPESPTINIGTNNTTNGFQVGPLYTTTTFRITCTNVAINGVCNNNIINSCTSGTANDAIIADDVNYNKWRCDGSGGGTNSGTCQKAKMVYTVDSRAGGANMADPKNYSGGYTICGSQSGPFTHSMATASSATPIGAGTQLYIYGTTVVSDTKAQLPALTYWWENGSYWGLKWFKTASSNTIWEVNPLTGVIVNGTRSCP